VAAQRAGNRVPHRSCPPPPLFFFKSSHAYTPSVSLTCLLISLSGVKCLLFPQEELLNLKILVGVVAGIGILLLWFTLAMRPVVPEADWLLAHMLRWFSTVIHRCMCFQGAASGGEELGEMGFGGVTSVFEKSLAPAKWLKSKAQALIDRYNEQNGPQYVKLLLTYMQVLGSFTMFR